MDDNGKIELIEQLLNDLMDGHTNPEEISKSYPELWPEISERWTQMCRVKDELDALFPATPSSGPLTPDRDQDLPRIAGNEVEAARPESRIGRLMRQIRKRPGLSAALVIAALLALALAVVGLWMIL